MKKRLFFLFLIVGLFACNSNKKVNALKGEICAPLKNGTFFNKKKSYKVVRNKNSQIEYDLETGAEYHFEVHWLYECAYNLKLKHTNNKSDTFALKPNDLLRVQMIEVNDSSFKYEVDFNQQTYSSILYR